MKALNLRWLEQVKTVSVPKDDGYGAPLQRVRKLVSRTLQYQTIEKITLPHGVEHFIETDWTDIPTVVEDLDELEVS